MRRRRIRGCHGLAPLEVHVLALNSKKREAPRDKRVASSNFLLSLSLATKRKYHGQARDIFDFWASHPSPKTKDLEPNTKTNCQ